MHGAGPGLRKEERVVASEATIWLYNELHERGQCTGLGPDARVYEIRDHLVLVPAGPVANELLGMEVFVQRRLRTYPVVPYRLATQAEVDAYVAAYGVPDVPGTPLGPASDDATAAEEAEAQAAYRATLARLKAQRTAPIPAAVLVEGSGAPGTTDADEAAGRGKRAAEQAPPPGDSDTEGTGQAASGSHARVGSAAMEQAPSAGVPRRGAAPGTPASPHAGTTGNPAPSSSMAERPPGATR
jgi:hypothetical protein